MSKGWKTKAANPVASHTFEQHCGISSILADVVSARGMTDVEALRRFLDPDLVRDWTAPSDIAGMDGVCDALAAAISANKRILVFGDFDVDGITATSLMIKGLSLLGVTASHMIPNRISDGYGLTAATVERIIELKPDLVITVDCGISSKEEVGALVSQGIAVLVTDHHEPSDNVPEHIPVADPKLDRSTPNQNLAGVGVALKLLALLSLRFGKPELWHELIDLAALGTVADLMPLTGENRSLVAAGLKRIRTGTRPGIASLFSLFRNSDSAIGTKELSFTIIPRLNAAGRMGDPGLALELLMEDDPTKAHDTALALDAINTRRRKVESDLLTEAMDALSCDAVRKKIIIVAGEGWHEGVKGIIASRLVNRFGVPAIVFSIVDGQARGSGRSAGTVNLFKALEACADILERFGGHEAAVGVTLDREKLPAFTERMEKAMAEIPDAAFEPMILVDCEPRLSALNVPSVAELTKLEPYGQENPEPLFATRGVFLRNARSVGAKKNHLSCTVTDGASSIQAIWFQCPQVEEYLSCEGPVDIVYRTGIDEWNGTQRVKLFIERIFRDGERHDDATGDARELWRRKCEDDAGSLDGEIASCLAGDPVQLHASQKQALADLGAGVSLLSIMATGRGKSLIFQIHAARRALTEGTASIFIYPLRALIADQYRFLKAGYKRLGLTVEALTGELDTCEKDRIFLSLYSGEIDVILTTPEFFRLHVWRFAGAGRIRFIVFDEAHHLGTETRGGRSAYRLSDEVFQLFKGCQMLAVTATADERITESICEPLRLSKVLIDDHRRDNLFFEDFRNIKDRTTYAVEVAKTGHKSVIYVNTRVSAVDLVRSIRKHGTTLGDGQENVVFYHAGLTKTERSDIEQGFKRGRYRSIVATCAFGEGVNIPDISDVLLYHLPFSLVAFNQMSGRAGRNGKKARIHLLFDTSDIVVNRKILSSAAPSRDDLVLLYRALQRFLDDEQGPQDFIHEEVCLDSIAAIYRRLDAKYEPERKMISESLAILEELEIITALRVGSEIKLGWRNRTDKVDLASSSRFLEGRQELLRFEQFSEWAFTAGVESMREYITGPITPIRMKRESDVR